MAGRLRRHWKGLTAAAIALVVILVVGVPYVYIHFIEGEQPAPLSLADTSSTAGTPDDAPSAESAATSSAADGGPTVTEPTSAGAPGESTQSASSSGTAANGELAGTWTIGAGSQAGYRVDETLAGQATVAVGRTDAVTGTLTIDAAGLLTAADVTVQVGDIASDNGQRDRQFTGRILQADQYPTATFTLTQPVSLAGLPDDGSNATVSATGDLTVHGVTQPVTFPLTAQQTDGGLAATGTIDIAYADYGIDNPSIGGFVSVGDSGTIEFLLVATRD